MLDGDLKRIVVVDDEPYICNIVVEALAGEPYETVAFDNPAEALSYIQENQIDLVLTDLIMGEHSGIQILETAKASHKDVIVVLMTAHPTVQTAISVLRRGAHDFLIKPFKLEILRATIRRGLEHQRIMRENVQLKGQVNFLKVANTIRTGDEVETYMSRLVGLCKSELSASVAAFLEVGSESGKVVRTLVQADDDIHDYTVVASEDTLQAFSYTKSNRAICKAEQVNTSAGSETRIVISQPVFVRRKLSGVINLLVQSRFNQITPGQLDLLGILANSAASALANYRLYRNLHTSFLQAIRALANAIEARDPYTAGHTDRVCKLAELVGRHLEWTQDRIDNLVVGCSLHDVGKIGVPDSILKKPGQLTDDEYAQMTRHPEVGLKIIAGVDLLKSAAPLVISHHERFDGKGYPKGLKGEEIPIEGRLVAVVDTFDAILSDRPYRKGRSIDVAVSELVKNKSIQFDPNMVESFLTVLREGKVDFQTMYGRSEDLSCLDKIVGVSETEPA